MLSEFSFSDKENDHASGFFFCKKISGVFKSRACSVYNCNETSCAKSWRAVSHAVKFIPGVPLNFDPCFLIPSTPIQRDNWDIFFLILQIPETVLL